MPSDRYFMSSAVKVAEGRAITTERSIFKPFIKGIAPESKFSRTQRLNTAVELWH